MNKMELHPAYFWYEDIKTDDGIHFYCWLCDCNIFGLQNAGEHGLGARHYDNFLSSEYGEQLTESDIQYQRRIMTPDMLHNFLRRNYVDLEDLEDWEVDGVELFTVDSDDGEIRCELCDEEVHVTEVMEHCVKSAVHSEIRSDIIRLCAQIKTDRAECDSSVLYCFDCQCHFYGRKTLISHITGKKHLSNCGKTTEYLDEISSYQDYCTSLIENMPFKLVTVDDLRSIVKDVENFTVTADGPIYCILCQQTVRINDLEDHCKHGIHVTQLLCDNVRVVGRKEFYCFSCFKYLETEKLAIQHARGKEHVARHLNGNCKLPAQSGTKYFKFKNITMEHLKLIVREEATNFDIKVEKIYYCRVLCRLCGYDVHIISAQKHINSPSHKQKREVCQFLCKTVRKFAGSTMYFYCSTCPLEIIGSDSAREHVLSSCHLSHFPAISNEIDKSRNHYMDLLKDFELPKSVFYNSEIVELSI